jgi:hypothetical protein
LDAYLDRQFSVLYDRPFSVEPAVIAATSTSGASRIVVAEYPTGVFCSGCWTEDRAFSAISRRYPASRVITLGYHGHFPIAILADSMWDRVDAWYPAKYKRVDYRGDTIAVIPMRTTFSPRGDTLTSIWVDGIGLPRHSRPPGASPAENLYRTAARSIDSALEQPPQARIRVRVTPRGGRVAVATTIDSVRGRHAHLALRLVLVQDTVVVRGGTNRRVYFNAVRAAAQAEGLPIGLPMPTMDSPGTVASIAYTFDVAALNRALQEQHDPVAFARSLLGSNMSAEELAENAKDCARLIAPFPDPRDWAIDPARLSVVAFVQDLDTSEVLQAAVVKVPALASVSAGS